MIVRQSRLPSLVVAGHDRKGMDRREVKQTSSCDLAALSISHREARGGIPLCSPPANSQPSDSAWPVWYQTTNLTLNRPRDSSSRVVGMPLLPFNLLAALNIAVQVAFASTCTNSAAAHTPCSGYTNSIPTVPSVAWSHLASPLHLYLVIPYSHSVTRSPSTYCNHVSGHRFGLCRVCTISNPVFGAVFELSICSSVCSIPSPRRTPQLRRSSAFFRPSLLFSSSFWCTHSRTILEVAWLSSAPKSQLSPSCDSSHRFAFL